MCLYSCACVLLCVCLPVHSCACTSVHVCLCVCTPLTSDLHNLTSSKQPTPGCPRRPATRSARLAQPDWPSFALRPDTHTCVSLKARTKERKTSLARLAHYDSRGCQRMASKGTRMNVNPIFRVGQHRVYTPYIW
jgi:hypothetical protein